MVVLNNPKFVLTMSSTMPPFMVSICISNMCLFKQGQEKMSKSDPNSAIFMEDTEAEVEMLRPHALLCLGLGRARETNPQHPHIILHCIGIVHLSA